MYIEFAVKFKLNFNSFVKLPQEFQPCQMNVITLAMEYISLC